MKLRDWVPREFFGEFDDTKAAKYLDVDVVEQYGLSIVKGEIQRKDKPWPGKHRYVWNWVILANGYAVGWNENPNKGWSFPVIRIN
jgi:hypothetical protein